MALTRKQQLNLVWGVVAGGSAAIGFTMGVLDRPLTAPLEFSIIVAGAVIFGLGGAIWLWRLLDEAQREAHKIAWFWGGSIGMLVGLLAAVGVMGQAPGLLHTLNPGGEPDDYVRLGILVVLLAQFVGYGLAWVWWWRSRR